MQQISEQSKHNPIIYDSKCDNSIPEHQLLNHQFDDKILFLRFGLIKFLLGHARLAERNKVKLKVLPEQLTLC